MRAHYFNNLKGANKEKAYLASNGLQVQKYAKPLSGYFTSEDQQRLDYVAKKFGMVV